MTIIDQTEYPHAVTVRFDSSEQGRVCFPHLSRAFKSYEGQFHREFDYRSIDFYVKTPDQKTRFENQSRDITKRLLNGSSTLRLTVSS